MQIRQVLEDDSGYITGLALGRLVSSGTMRHEFERSVGTLYWFDELYTSVISEPKYRKALLER